jgi:hypothetical protein
MRDASLDDFLSSSDEETEGDEPAVGSEADDMETGPESDPRPEPEPETGPESDTEPDADTAGPPSVTEVEPARSTYAWSPDGATCAECGESVEERWESEAGLVCVECKEW